MPVKLFIQDTTGDYNYEQEFASRRIAAEELSRIRKDEGYWIVEEADEDTPPNDIFVPWHQVGFARIEETEEEAPTVDI